MSQANKIIDTNNFRVGWGSGNWFKKYLVSRLASKNYILLLQFFSVDAFFVCLFVCLFVFVFAFFLRFVVVLVCFVFFKIDKERVGQRVN
jgi:fatty acid desaturase